jgi:hypothetical protein
MPVSAAHSRRFLRAPVAIFTLLALAGIVPSPRTTAAGELDLAAPAALEEDGCGGGDPIDPTQVIEGSFAADLQGATVMVPFDVPAGTTSVRVKYCWDRPEGPTPGNSGHTIDLGIWEARPEGSSTWGLRQFRGWGGSSHPDVTVTPQGFSTESEYLASPKGHVPGRTTRGFLPGPIPAGEWAAELGVAAVVPASEGDADGSVRWRLEIELASDPAFAAEPYLPARYDRHRAAHGPAWYAGDMHVHAEHSALGDATMSEVFDYAFRPLADGGAGLDFITLSDYVTSSGWGEIGRYQRQHPGKLVIRSSEIITYTGHTNNHASATYVDHRMGPVYERRPDGTLVFVRTARPARDIFRSVHRNHGFTQINHPTIFPSSDSTFRRLCRGCPWDFTPEETDFSQVDAIEIQTGPAAFGDQPNPFTVTAIDFWEGALDQGHHIAAVGSSDSHKAGRVSDATGSPIGRPTTMVYARDLSERAIRDAVQAGHTYVKLLGNDGPDLRFEAVSGSGQRAIIGDTLAATAATFTASVSGLPDDAPEHTLRLLWDGEEIASFPVEAPGTDLRFYVQGEGRYRLQLQRGAVIVALTSPIYLERARPFDPRLPRLPQRSS